MTSENSDNNLGDELVAMRGQISAEWLERTGLFLYGKATDDIWAMTQGDGISLFLDSGDAGSVYLTKEQARALIKILHKLTD